MMLLCRFFGHDWILAGGVARDAMPNGNLPHVTYNCRRCSDTENIKGIDVLSARRLAPFSPSRARQRARGGDR